MIFMRCHEDTVMLRSTTGPYGRPVIEVTYGEMILSGSRYIHDLELNIECTWTYLHFYLDFSDHLSPCAVECPHHCPTMFHVGSIHGQSH